MNSWLKALIVLAIVLPMTAYVAASLASSSAREPVDRGPVIINDAPSPASPPTSPATARPLRTPTPTPTASPPSTPSTPVVPKDDSEAPAGSNEARVVTPQPTAVSDDDEADDRAEGDDDDSETMPIRPIAVAPAMPSRAVGMSFFMVDPLVGSQWLRWRRIHHGREA